MKLDYRILTKKDLFIAKLKKEPIHFGFIPIWRLKEFVRFCIKYELITLRTENYVTVFDYDYYQANYDFIYIYTAAITNFRPLSFITRWLSDLLGHYLSKRQQYSLTPFIRCFRTTQRTFSVGGPDRVDWNYIIDRNKYIL